MDLNKVMLIGRLTRDPELRNTTNGKSVTSFGLATNRYWKGQDGNRQEQVEFHNIVLWGRLAEIASQYLGKGRRIYIEGRMQTREWTGQDGTKRRTTEVVGDNMIMLDSSKGGGQQPAGENQYVNVENEPASQAPQPITPQETIEEEVKVEDIPF
jgi:single-strand DNA-binding protein